jgi:hypothetical protein
MPPSVAEKVRAVVATLVAPTPGGTPAPTIVECVRALDTALKQPGAAGNEAATEFCNGPAGKPEQSALRWCATMLQRGVPADGNPQDVKHAIFVVTVVLQVLISGSGADHRQQFGHISRSGAHTEACGCTSCRLPAHTSLACLFV